MSFRLAALVLTAALLSAGCAAAPTPEADAPDGTISIDHRFGTTEVPAPADRIVSLTPAYTDALTAVGVTPVAVGSDAVSGDDGLPWQQVPPPTETERVRLGTDFSIPVESLVALQPDLILAGALVIDQSTYDALSAIAPTVPALGEAFDTPWQDLTRQVGQLTAREAEADAAIAESEAALTRWREANPEVVGRTWGLALGSGAESVQVVSDPADSAAGFFDALGMRIAPQLVGLGGGQDGVQGAIAAEQFGLLADSDVLLVGYTSTDARQQLEASPLFARLPQIEQGRYVPLDIDTAYALRQPSIATGPWLIDRLGPALATAGGG